MNIFVTFGKGQGKTLISAFDAALKDAGVANYNLITLSSIIPPHSRIIVRRYETPLEDYGKRLYVVKAELRSRESGKHIGAALGWYQIEDKRGVFVEHEEVGETKKAVQSNLDEEVHSSLRDVCRARGYSLDEKRMKIKMCITQVKDSPASALVIAVYKSEGWE